MNELEKKKWNRYLKADPSECVNCGEPVGAHDICCPRGDNEMNAECGHDLSNIDVTVETNTRFCRMCDLDDRRQDAEVREKELYAENVALRSQLAAVTAQRNDLIRDSVELDEQIVALALKLGIPQSEIDGDSHGVPGSGELVDLIGGRVDELIACLRKIANHGDEHTEEKLQMRIYAVTYYRWMKSCAAAILQRLPADAMIAAEKAESHAKGAGK